MPEDIKWIDALDDLSVGYAAGKWGLTPYFARQIIEKAIKDELLSARLPQSEFMEYVKLVPPKQSEPITQPVKKKPPRLSWVRKFLDNFAWQWLIFICIIISCLFNILPSQSPSPTPTFYPTPDWLEPTQLAKSRTDAACLEDSMANVPYEYSRCNPNPIEDHTFDPYDSLDPYADTGCPNGCDSPPPDCNIKGNISAATGEKIYHMPGQDYYANTTINPAYGERWFCTEEEARANGWRKAYQ